MLQLVTRLRERSAFWHLNPCAQAVVIAHPALGPEEIRNRWRERAAFAMWEDGGILCDLVRELLHNPQIRAVVFDGGPVCAEAFKEFWYGDVPVDWKINDEHLRLVRQFVDLYDGDFGHRGPQQPFWPLRIKYLE